MQRGEVAPEFELPDQHGVPRRLSRLLAVGPVVLFFYPDASSSGCTAEMCSVRDLDAEFAAAGAQRIGISRDHVAAQAKFARTNGLGFPLLADVDGTVCTAYGVARNLRVAPVKRHTVVIGADAVVREVFRSEFRFTAHAEKALATLQG